MDNELARPAASRNRMFQFFWWSVTGLATLLQRIWTDRPGESKGTLAGAALGLALGLHIGGLGIAMLGGAFGLSGWFLLMLIFGFCGNRIGMERDRMTGRRGR